MTFLQVGMVLLAGIITAFAVLILWLAGHGMVSHDQWQQGDDE